MIEALKNGFDPLSLDYVEQGQCRAGRLFRAALHRET